MVNRRELTVCKELQVGRYPTHAPTMEIIKLTHLIISKILKAKTPQTVNVYRNIPRDPATDYTFLLQEFTIPAMYLGAVWALLEPL